MKKELLTMGIIAILLIITFSGCVENRTQDKPGGQKEQVKEQNFHSNLKDMAKYEDKMVFLISDKNWRDVLSSIPLSIWTNSNSTITEYPLLIYHDEEKGQIPVDITYLANSTYEIWDYYHGQDIKGNITGISISKNLVDYEEDFTLTLKVKNFEQQALDLSSIPMDGFHIIYNGWMQQYPSEFFNGIFNYTGMSIEDAVQIWAPGEEININFNYRQNNVPGFDADSIIHFMQQYSVKKVVNMEHIPNELSSLIFNLKSTPEIVTLDSGDYLSYWNLTKNIVLVDYDDYNTGLFASVFASYCNAPILFINSNNLNEYKDLINNKQVFMIGNIDSSVVDYVNIYAKNFTTFNLQELLKEYARLTEADKIILVDSGDIEKEKAITEKFQPEKTTRPILNLYYKTSLAAPILASAKHELILSVPSDDCTTVDQYLKNQIKNLELNISYLTIVSSPDAIQMARDVPPDIIDAYGQEEVDNHIYGNLDEDFFQELAVGRIFGITISDVTSYMARDLFLNELPHFPEFAAISGDPSPYGIIPAIGELLESAGYSGYANSSDIAPDDSIINLTNLEHKFIILYIGHGSQLGLQRGINTQELSSNKILLDSPIIFAEACLTCKFNSSEFTQYKGQELFCPNILRRGALAYIGAVDPSGVNFIGAKGFIDSLLQTNSDIGQVMRILKNREAVDKAFLNGLIYHQWYEKENNETMLLKKILDYDKYYVLIGDPTIKIPVLSPEISENEKVSVNFNGSSHVITFQIPPIYKRSIIEDRRQDLVINYTKGIYKCFVPPFSSIGLSFAKGEEKWYNGSQFMDTLGFDYSSYVFFVDLPSNEEIKNVIKVDYIENGVHRTIVKMPVFTSTSTYQGDFISYYRDNEIANRYWFSFAEILGGDPQIVVTQDELPSYEYQIFLELS